MKSIALILFAVLSLGAVACGAPRGSSVAQSLPDTPSPAEATPAPTATPEPEAQIVSLEGAFSYDEMPDYLDAVAPMVAAYYEQQYPDIPDPRLVYIPSRQVARSGCGYLYSDAYAYCAANQAIYVGQDLLWAFYRQAGDAAPALGLAHEWGHHVQYYRGVPYGRTAAQSVDFENQADCLSGAWARYADEQGWLEREDDLQDVATLMQFIGSRESSSRDHGTTAERADAFQRAFTTGIDACNAYFPHDPVA
jgi:predicted metalloprotease